MNKRKSNISAGVGVNVPRQHVESAATREGKAQSGHLLCKRCNAEYHDKHWYTTDSSLHAELPRNIKETLCPGCYRVENNIVMGVLTLETTAAGAEAITALIKHVEHECWLDNPTSRIIELTNASGNIEIKTTTTWLAERLGKEVKKAFKGHLEIKPSPEKETVFVRWSERNK